MSNKLSPIAFRPKIASGTPVHLTPLNPLTFLLRCASIRPNHIGLTHPEKGLSWTFAEWATRVSHLAYALKASGIKPGDRVLICSPNVPLIADLLFAIPAAQGVIVPINNRLTASEVDYLIENSGATLVFVDHEFAPLVVGSKVPVIVSHDSGKADCPYEQFIAMGAEFDRRNGDLGWSGLEFQRDENATFAISYTSGTTSRPKGVETTYRGTYLAAVANAVESGLGANSKYLWILPMMHCLGWTFGYASCMAMATQECLRSVGDYTDIWKGILERGVTHYCGAPTVQLSIINNRLARKLTTPVHTSIAGAAPTSTLLEGLETLGFNPSHVYGLTETYGPITKTYFIDRAAPNYYELQARQGAGFLTADDIRVVRQLTEGTELTTEEGDLEEVRMDGSEIGEIVMRGNIVMKGYWKNEKETKKAFAGGFFHTGDLAVRFPDGTFSIADRSKDIVISGGENISSLFVESHLTTHPDVLEVAIVARASEKWGERPHAFVVLKDPSKWHGKDAEFETHVKAHSRGKMPGFAIPEWVEIVPVLEKTSTGKVQKNVLRAQLKSRFPPKAKL